VDLDLAGGIAASGIIVGLVQLAKTLGFPTKFAGLLSVGMGLIMAVVYSFFRDTTWFQVVVLGLGLGLAASGGWSTVKSAASQ
jgi:4-hydroxybenzoate polyprenyltransferase